MICRDKIIFSCLIACGLGAAGGYLFSSNFCKVTIVKRVAKEIALNKTLRQLFTENAFWTHNYIRSIFFNLPDQIEIAEHLSKNQEKLATIFKAYYGAAASEKFKQLSLVSSSLIPPLMNAKKENLPASDITDAWKKNSTEITALLSQLNPAWQGKTWITRFDQLNQSIEALQKNNWNREIELFNSHLEDALQRADELDAGITKQFPEKF
jgi:hypothetical protein